MDLNRREFLAHGAAAAGAVLAGAALQASLITPASSLPWVRRVRRVGQTNMTEHDPVTLDVEQWADYWASLKVDAVLVSVTGIVAFYPTQIEHFKRAQFLGERDLLGECCSAAKKRGLRVIARLSPDQTWQDFLLAKPEWFERREDGQPVRNAQDKRLCHTCVFSDYFTEHIPAIMREVNARYSIDAIFTNGFPGIPRQCYCDRCRTLPRAHTVEYWELYDERLLGLWKDYDAIAKEGRPANVFFGNCAPGAALIPKLRPFREICEWFNCDNQGRAGADAPIWGAAQQGRVAWAAMKGKTTSNATAAYAAGPVAWRNAAKEPAEVRMWLNEVVASGMIPWYHFIGAEKGLGEDRRWQQPGRRFFNWLARHDRHFSNRRSLSNLGVVLGQRTHLFHPNPASDGTFLQLKVAAGSALPKSHWRLRGSADRLTRYRQSTDMPS